MTTHTYAVQANGSAGDTRVRAFRSCPVSPAVSLWGPISATAAMVKHGRPRRTEASHP